jgi:hypothetical protein
MSDTLTVGDENLISSKRASELSGYAQDYIGQLARKGFIQAKRIGGLWYVSLDSLNAYKTSSDSYTPRPPQAMSSSSENDSIISLDGRDYLSAARAAKVTGYTADYVGQLARSGKILSRQVGNRWYVERNSIESHKEEKDALLGAVQAQAVGISPQKEEKRLPSLSSEPFFQYRTEGRDLIPKPQNDRGVYKGMYDDYEELAKPIRIRRTAEKVSAQQYEEEVVEKAHEIELEPVRQTWQKGKKKVPYIALGCLFAVIALGGGGFYALQTNRAEISQHVSSPMAASAAMSSPIIAKMTSAGHWFENFFGKEITYQKAKK